MKKWSNYKTVIAAMLFLVTASFCTELKNNSKSEEKEKLAINDWTRHHIADLPDNSMYIRAADVDGDGAIDILAGGWWWKNPGQLDGVWQKNTIGEPLNNLAIVHDLDGDGDVDIVGTEGVGASTNRHFLWARNEGNGKFTIMTNVDSCESGDFLQGVELINVDKENYIALSWHKGGLGTYLLHIPKNPSEDQWTMQMVTETTQKEDISVGDIDRDGDDDMLLGTIWLENTGKEWVAHTIGITEDLDADAEPDRNDLADVNGDGRIDAVVALEKGKHVLWFKAPEDPTQVWERNSLGDIDGQGFSMDVQDFDNDGDPDLVIGEHRGEVNNRVVIFQNFDAGRTWSKVVIDSGPKDFIDHHDGTVAVDIDNDGDFDIISVGWYNPKVWLFENKAK